MLDDIERQQEAMGIYKKHMIDLQEKSSTLRQDLKYARTKAEKSKDDLKFIHSCLAGLVLGQKCKSIGCGLCRKCSGPLQQVWERVQNSLSTDVIETHRRQKDVEFSHVNYLGAIGAENDS